jgi:hypothetical protein
MSFDSHSTCWRIEKGVDFLSSEWFMFVAIVAFYVLKVLLFLTFCFLAAGVYALFAWLLRHREPARQFKISGAALRSPIFVFYMLACASTFLVFGPEHLQRPFSHGEEPLPNGYVLTAPIEDASLSLLSAPTRIPGFSRIEFALRPAQHTVNGFVRSLEVEGPLIFGAYNWRYDSSPDKDIQANQGYFVFDTRRGTVVDFRTGADLTRSAGHDIHLVQAESFRSSDVFHRRFLIVEHAIVLGLPLACVLLFLVFLVRGLANQRPSGLEQTAVEH